MPISIPAVGSVLTPPGFAALSAQGAVLLSWSYTPIATTYYVSRSTDNVTFAPLAQTASLNYSDTTGTIGTVYYYYVQAATATASSIHSASVAALSLAPGQTTLGNLRTQAKQRVNLERSQNITDQEWNVYISDSYKWLYNHLVEKYGNEYFVQVPYRYTTTGAIDPSYQAQVFPLPPDFLKLLRVEVALNPSDPHSWVTLKKFQAIQANLWNFPNVYTFYGITNLRYRLWGNQLQIVPLATAGQTIRIWYVPRPNQLINDTDIVDGLSNYDELIIIDADIKALAKQEGDISVFAAQKAFILKEIEEAAENRDIGSPETVSDARRTNFSWGDPDGGGSW